MTAGLAVVRPEPGNTITADALAADGHDVARLPLFEVRPVVWQPPDPARFDALLLTSANAVRHAGASLGSLATLPAVAVGDATAAAARKAGLDVVATGTGDGIDAVAVAHEAGFSRLLHLAGREHRMLPGVMAIVTYASEAMAIDASRLAVLAGRVVLLHSPRAACRLGALTETIRGTVAIAGLSAAVTVAAGSGWRDVTTALTPTDAALRAASIALASAIDRPGSDGDKRA